MFFYENYYLIFRLAIIYYFPKIHTNAFGALKRLMKARDDGLNELDCKSLYPKCDESELHKMQYTYWIIPWNPMGNGNLLFKFLSWAFNK